MMLDLPQPLGPTTPVMLVGRCRVVGSTKDLKPDSLIVDRRMRRRGTRLRPGRWLACACLGRKGSRDRRYVIDSHRDEPARTPGNRWSIATLVTTAGRSSVWRGAAPVLSAGQRIRVQTEIA